MKRETPIVKAILEALAARRIWAWRTNSGVIIGEHKGKKWAYRGAPAGTPDILGVLGDGRMFGIEVKTPDGEARASQQRWHDKAQARGVPVGFAKTAREALALVDEWERKAVA